LHRIMHFLSCVPASCTMGMVGLNRDGPRAETRFRLSEKRTSPFESAEVSA
jgi:hypothetical protein